MIKYSIDNVHPTRDLTPHEKVFLQGLAEYKLFLDKSLFFQIDDLQKHTELVLSGEKETAYRYEFPDPDELKKEIEELEKMIKELEGELSQKYWALLKEYRKRLEKLKEALDKMKKGSSSTMIFRVSLLGKYEHKNGDNSRVTLYVNNIEAYAKNSYDIMLLMGQVLLHEYFHSFYYHVGVGSKERIKCVEEPMAEFGSLVFLDSVASSESSVAIYADHSLKYALGFVKKKQKCEGITAAYGFGAYIFDKHKEDFPYLIAEYANVSRLLDAHERRILEYKYMVYPTYPDSHFEGVAYEKLKRLLEAGIISAKGIKTLTKKAPKAAPVLTHTSVAGGIKGSVVVKDLRQFALEVFKFLKNKGLLGSLLPFVTVKRSPELRTLTVSGEFKLTGILNDGSRITRSSDWFMSDTFVIGSDKYYLSTQWSIKNTNTHLHFDDLKRMIEYIYPKTFDIQKKSDVFIMNYKL